MGIQYLHEFDPSLVNEFVTETGYMALHFAVRNKNHALLEYLLSHGADVNARGGPDYNTALHEAVMIDDIDSMRILFRYNVKDELKNGHQKRAFEYCQNRRRFIKAKQSTTNNQHLAI